MHELYETCARLLAAGEDLVTATIVSRSGSAPRTAGTMMLVRRDGSFVGTIGGGLLEAMVLQEVEEVFRSGRPSLRQFHLTGDDAAGMDMICGGRLEVFIDYLSAGVPENVQIFRTIARLLHSGKKALLVTRLSERDGCRDRFGRCLLLQDGRRVGADLPVERWEPVLRDGAGRYPRLVQVDGDTFLVEPVSSPHTVYLFGAGHVAQKVARLASFVGFRTVVLDDREEFANRQRFPEAEDIIVLDDFEHAMKDLPVGRDSYLVIVTRGHRYDLTVLAQALRTGAGYIGMIGSAGKRETIYRALREAGVTGEQLARVHSPIGLPIGAETPEEIAVSIVAELIKARGELTNG